MKNYNSTLQSNNLDLQAILDTINSLPNAGGGANTSDATATASDILLDKTAYARGSKITGTFTLEEELAEQEALLLELETTLSQSASKSEVWILTLSDGTTVEKEVSLYDN